jgi:hypothetical protein
LFYDNNDLATGRGPELATGWLTWLLSPFAGGSRMLAYPHTDHEVYDDLLTKLRVLLDSPGDQHDRAAQLWQALCLVEEPLRQQLVMDCEVDQAGQTVHRRQLKLRQRHSDLLEKCLALKWQLYRAAQPLVERITLVSKAALGPYQSSPQPDFRDLESQVDTLLDQLEECRSSAVYLVLESTTTDIGGSD